MPLLHQDVSIVAGATCGGRRLEQQRRLQEAAKVDYATWNADEIARWAPTSE